MTASKFIATGSLGLGWLVVFALTACETPNIPAKAVPKAEDRSTKPEIPETDPDEDTDEVADSDDDDERDAGGPDAGDDEPAATTDDPLPGVNTGGPIAGAGVSGSGAGGAGGGAGAAGSGGGSAIDPDSGAALVGFWTGRVVDILGPMFDLCMEITQVGTVGVAGTTNYSNGVLCGGELSYIGAIRDTFSFGERIVRGGPCIPAGRIDMRLNSDDTLDWEWFRTGTDVPQETGTLERVDGCPQ